MPVRVEKIRQNKNVELLSDSIGSESSSCARLRRDKTFDAAKSSHAHARPLNRES